MEAPNVTANIVCTACGGAGHIAKDCKNPRSGVDAAVIDAEVIHRFICNYLNNLVLRSDG